MVLLVSSRQSAYASTEVPHWVLSVANTLTL